MAAGGPSVTCHPADAGDEQCLRCGCSSPSCTVVRCYLPPGRCWRQAMSEVWMYQSVMYCGTVLPATRQMLATSNVWGVDVPVRHVLWYSVTCHPADAGDEQCLRCGCTSPSCTVVLCAADIDGPLHTACKQVNIIDKCAQWSAKPNLCRGGASSQCSWSVKQHWLHVEGLETEWVHCPVAAEHVTLKTAHSHGRRTGRPSNNGSSGPHESASAATESLVVQPFLQDSQVWRTDRQTQHR